MRLDTSFAKDSLLLVKYCFSGEVQENLSFSSCGS
jgi:hypothetical protein